MWRRRHRRFLPWGGWRREQRPCIIRDYAAGLATASPTLAIDFPLKALAWEDAHRKVWLTYNAPEYLKSGTVPEELLRNMPGLRNW